MLLYAFGRNIWVVAVYKVEDVVKKVYGVLEMLGYKPVVVETLP
ncbi:MAG: hypothetical protein RQ885_04255 [Desulfurococcales archaeon]|jgi:hypothetical protein|nr:hypothetical protein [Desulfurococcales archaeon]